MASALTTIKNADNRANPRGNIGVLEVEWTSHTDGSVDNNLGFLAGEIMAIETKPDGTDTPTTYKVEIQDEYAYDVLEGDVTTRSTSAVERIVPSVAGSGGLTDYRPVVSGTHSLVISGAGSGKKGKVKIFLR